MANLKLNKSKIIALVDKVAMDKKNIILAVIVGLTLIYVDFSFVLKPQLQASKVIDGKIRERKKEINKVKLDLQASRDIKLEQEKEGKQLSKAKKIISEGEMPALLKVISDLANKNQVRLNQIKPSRDTKDAKSAKAQKFDTISISLDLTAGYHQLGAFINDMENGDALVWLSDLRVVSNPNDFFHQDVRLIFKAYVKK
jgi:Tfp pilus assembly protein PilO